MALWYTVVNDTHSSTVGADINNADIYGIITPVNPSNGIHSGAYLQASNFKIGGATETDGSGSALTGSNIWENGNMDIPITKVHFEDEGTAGDINNTVKFTATFGSATPTVDTTYYIDIDEKADNLVSTNPPRSVCFYVNVPYVAADDPQAFTHEFYDPSNNLSTWSVQSSTSGGITRTLVNADTQETDGYSRYKFSGTISNYEENSTYSITRILLRRTNLDFTNFIDPLPGAGDPDFTEHAHFFLAWGGIWTSLILDNPAYNEMYIPTGGLFGETSGWDFSGVYSLYLDININPLDSQWAIDHEANGMCQFGHTIDWKVKTYEPTVVEEEIDSGTVIKSMQLPDGLGTSASWQDITVRGTEGATYEIYLYKTTGADKERTNRPDTGYSWWDFRNTGGIVNYKPQKYTHTMPSAEKQVHSVLLPKTNTDDRYVVYVNPVGDTVIRDGVPTLLDPRPIISDGVYTVTINPTVDTPSRWDISGISASFKRKPKTPYNNFNPAIDHISVEAELQSAATDTDRIVLKRQKSNQKLTEGMYVMCPMLGNSNAAGSGIPHLTTIRSIKDNVIVLSNAISGTIAANTEIRFELKSSRIFPFSLACSAGGGAGTYRNLSIQTGNSYFPQFAIGGLKRRAIECTISGDCNDIAQVQCVKPTLMHGKAGMVVRARNADGTQKIFKNGKTYVDVSSMNVSSKRANLTTNVTFLDGEKITLEEHPDAVSTNTYNTVEGVQLLHAQAVMTTSSGDPANNKEVATVSGYLDILKVSNDVTLHCYVDLLVDNDAS